MRLVDPWSIEHYYLVIGPVEDADDPISGGLRFWRNNRYLLAKQTIQQGRFADIGRSDQGDDSGFYLFLRFHDQDFFRWFFTVDFMAANIVLFKNDDMQFDDKPWQCC